MQFIASALDRGSPRPAYPVHPVKMFSSAPPRLGGNNFLMNREEAPLALGPVQRAGTQLAELQPRPRNQVFHRPRDEYLPRRGFPGYLLRQLDRETAIISIQDVAFAGVQPGRNLHA